MLLRFTTKDILNTTIIDCDTGAIVYEVTTPSPCSRSRSRSTTSLRSFASGGSASKEKLYTPERKVTSIMDSKGHFVAELTWAERHASEIKIGEETLAGTGEIFDAPFAKVLPNETLLPTRMEYTWRLTQETLTLLDDDEHVVGELHSDRSSIELLPAAVEGTGFDYLYIEPRSDDEFPELMVTYLLMCTLRDKLYSLTKHIYNQKNKPKSSGPIDRLKLRTTRSIVNLYQSIRRTVSPSSS